MQINQEPQKIGDIFKSKQTKKPPAYEWQDLALSIIDELGIPQFKRSAVFKACKENKKNIILKAMNDTKELCQTGQRWKYFFKVLNEIKKKKVKTPNFL